MSESVVELLDSTRLLYDLQRANEIIQGFSGCLEPESLACHTTNGLVERFNCAFSRIWLMEPDGTTLRLVASSGLYTRIDGDFAKVSLGAYKVGKIAQNRVSFLSNNLPEEAWVKDRAWAIANQIRGFAGFPLLVGNDVVGVLAVFSRSPLTPEFLEVLQAFCTTIAVMLQTTLNHQRQRSHPLPTAPLSLNRHALSDQVAATLKSARLTLIGTEQLMPPSHQYIFLEAAEILDQIGCNQSRLIYSAEAVALEGVVAAPNLALAAQGDWLRSHFGGLLFMATCLGGELQSQPGAYHKVIQVSLKLPYSHCKLGIWVQIRCHQSVLQLAFTQLAYAAGLQVYNGEFEAANHEVQTAVPLVTDDKTQLCQATQILWIRQSNESVPAGINACLDLSISPEQLRAAVVATMQGESWGMPTQSSEVPNLSEREREILGLLAQGLRDRDIANQLIISESTVKFHLNNVLAKLKARTRYEALHQAIVNGWL